MAKLDEQNRTPKVEILPDFRLRVTRNYDVQNFLGTTPANLAADVTIPWGTPDAKYPNCRLIRQDLAGQIDYDANQPNKLPPTLTRIYEEIPATAEVMVGDPEVNVGADGLTTVIELFLQFSTALPGITPFYGVPGTTLAAAPWAQCTLKLDERTDDGTLQRIKRTYISAGLINESEDIKYNGALSLVTTTYVNEVPPTPAGYTIIDTKVESPNGLPVYTYTFAKGTGQIDFETEYLQSIDQGGSGVTRETYRWLTTPSVSSNPVSTPSGFVLINQGYSEQDGYRLWTVVFAKGQGTVESDVTTREGGKLILYHIVALGTAPSAPSPTIGGSVVLIVASSKDAEGYVIFDYTWAEGIGEIGRNITFELSPDQGVSGITRTEITYISADSVSTDPTTGPVGSEKISSKYTESDGYRIWTSEYVSGTGLVSATVDVRSNGMLYIYDRTSINAFPPTPSASIGGTVVLIKNTQRNGTRIENGTTIYEATWAEGNGLISTDIVTRQDGLREVTNISIGTAIPPTGILIRDEATQDSGYTLFRQSAIQAANGDATPVGTVTTFQRNVPFLYPGVAKAYTITAENGWKAYDVFRRPPTHADVLANVIVTYATSGVLGTLPYPLWNPSNWATIEAQWIGLNNIPGYSIVALPGYRSFSATPLTFVASIWAGTVAGTMLGNVVYGGTTAVLVVTGGPAAPDGNTYTLDQAIELAFTSTDGVKYYRQTIVTATIPAQPALPV